jgi:hypothetical protein
MTSKLATCSTIAIAEGVGLERPRLMRSSRIIGTSGDVFYNLLSAVGSVATLAEVPCERRAAQPTAMELGIAEPGQIVVESCGPVIVDAGPNPRRKVRSECAEAGAE